MSAMESKNRVSNFGFFGTCTSTNAFAIWLPPKMFQLSLPNNYLLLFF